MNPKWFFPRTQGGEESGLNEPGIEFFKKSNSLARETLQNSGDAADENGSQPVRVSFELVHLPRDLFPGVGELREIIVSCREYVLKSCGNDEERSKEWAQAWFENALRLLDQSLIPVLRIRDENTTGLEGGEQDENKPWFRLIKKQGSGAMHGVGGGTFGIGQRAPFAFSQLRTVFYSTRTRSGGHAFIGKSILSSFRKDGRVFRNIGFWGVPLEDSDEGVRALREADDVPEFFRRATTGTDLYVMGFDSQDWRARLTESVLINFFAAIQGGSLVVEITGEGTSQKISRDNIEKFVESRIEQAMKDAGGKKSAQKEVQESLGATLHYLRALASPENGKPFELKHPKLGLMKLYVKRDQNALSKTVFMRRPRIAVFEKTQRLTDGHAAVFLCEEKEGNEILARMEDPAHKDWDQDRYPNDRNLLADIRKFVRDSLTSLAQRDPDEQQDVPSLGQYLPENEEIYTGSRKKGVRVRTREAVEEETARPQVTPGRKRATRSQELKNAQTLVVPIDSRDGSEDTTEASGEEAASRGGASMNAGSARSGDVPTVPVGATSTAVEVSPGNGLSSSGTAVMHGSGTEEVPGGPGRTGIGGSGAEPGGIPSNTPGTSTRPGTHGGPGQQPGGGGLEHFNPGVLASERNEAADQESAARGFGTAPLEGGTAGLLPARADEPGMAEGRRSLSQAQVRIRAWFSPEDQLTHLIVRSSRRGRASFRLVAEGEDATYDDLGADLLERPSAAQISRG